MCVSEVRLKRSSLVIVAELTSLALLLSSLLPIFYFVVGAKGFPSRLHRLAVASPRSLELDESVLPAAKDEVIEVTAGKRLEESERGRHCGRLGEGNRKENNGARTKQMEKGKALQIAFGF